MCNYPELTAEQYKQRISEVFEKIEDVRILRYFYIFISEKLLRTYNVKGGEADE